MTEVIVGVAILAIIFAFLLFYLGMALSMFVVWGFGLIQTWWDHQHRELP